jgi:hypothetical protein
MLRLVPVAEDHSGAPATAVEPSADMAHAKPTSHASSGAAMRDERLYDQPALESSTPMPSSRHTRVVAALASPTSRREPLADSATQVGVAPYTCVGPDTNQPGAPGGHDRLALQYRDPLCGTNSCTEPELKVDPTMPPSVDEPASATTPVSLTAARPLCQKFGL